MYNFDVHYLIMYRHYLMYSLHSGAFATKPCIVCMAGDPAPAVTKELKLHVVRSVVSNVFT